MYVILYIMPQVLEVILFSFTSGVTVLIGGLLARSRLLLKVSSISEVSHTVIAFGAGILVAAVAFVLTPKAIDLLSLPVLVALFLGGVISFLLLDEFISRRGGRLAQLMAMSMDYIPEAIALGAVFSYDRQTGLLLALFIGLQNLPESYNAYGDLLKSGFSPNKAMLVLAPFSFVGVIAALLGYNYLHGDSRLINSLMLFAAGGIMYLVFRDIAPMIKYRRHQGLAIGGTLGFALGIIGVELLG